MSDDFRRQHNAHRHVDMAQRYAVLAVEILEQAEQAALFGGHNELAQKLSVLGARVLALDFTIPPPPR